MLSPFFLSRQIWVTMDLHFYSFLAHYHTNKREFLEEICILLEIRNDIC